jgi:hypothetical protein
VALGVKHSTIKQAAQKAFALKQDWVKRELYGSAGTCARWILDTESKHYHEHEQRWRQFVARTATDAPSSMPAQAGDDEASEAQAMMPAICPLSPTCCTCMAQRPFDAINTLPDLCHWLAELGLVVFVNALEERPCWQWMWREERGTGYADAMAALTAALQHQSNARIMRLMARGAPSLLLRYEQRLLQQACDALFDNLHSSRPLTNMRGQPLKSLTDALTGKQGRFRRHLLGKRVDYSGCSVIAVGVDLRLHECGLPKSMALELFKPFVIRKLLDRHLAHTPRGAKRMVERRDPLVWDQLAECLHEKVVLLNRAPTLHRLSLQAFEPKNA